MTAGRHKSTNPKKNILAMRLTDAELAEIENLANKLKISKTETILRGIKLLKNPPKQIITRSMLPNFKPKKLPKVSEGVIEGETVMFDKK